MSSFETVITRNIINMFCMPDLPSTSQTEVDLTNVTESVVDGGGHGRAQLISGLYPHMDERYRSEHRETHGE